VTVFTEIDDDNDSSGSVKRGYVLTAEELLAYQAGSYREDSSGMNEHDPSLDAEVRESFITQCLCMERASLHL
jgi:hypothetical protein